MKKLLLLAFLLTVGIVISQNASAQTKASVKLRNPPPQIVHARTEYIERFGVLEIGQYEILEEGYFIESGVFRVYLELRKKIFGI